MTLSNGKYQEFFSNDTIVRIGSVLFNRVTNEVVEFLTDKNSSSLVEADVASRFLSVDPIGRKFPELTPYQFGSNRPIDGSDLDGLEWKCETIDGKNHVSVNIELSTAQKVIDAYNLTTKDIDNYKTAINVAMNNVMSSVGATGSVTFDGGDENKIGQVVPTLNLSLGKINTEGDFVAGVTIFQNADVSLNNREGRKPLELVGLDAIHELFHTLRLEHPFEFTQSQDAKLIFTGAKTIDWYGVKKRAPLMITTEETDPNISFNIMNYAKVFINGTQLLSLWKENPPNKITAGQFNFLLKEIKLQQQGYGLSLQPGTNALSKNAEAYYKKYFLDYWNVQQGQKTTKD